MKRYEIRASGTVTLVATIIASSEAEAMEVGEDLSYSDFDVEYDIEPDILIESCEAVGEEDDDG